MDNYTLKIIKRNEIILLVDEREVIHGAYATEKDALKVKATIESNLRRFYEKGQLVLFSKKKRRRPKHRRKRKSQRSKS